MQIVLGLLADNFYQPVMNTVRKKPCLLYRVKAKKFLQIIQEDFRTFKHFFDSAIQRFRYQKKLKKIVQSDNHRGSRPKQRQVTMRESQGSPYFCAEEKSS